MHYHNQDPELVANSSYTEKPIDLDTGDSTRIAGTINTACCQPIVGTAAMAIHR
jgi:hypothetical protein